MCDWSFGLHSIMAYQAPAPTWVHCKSYSSRYKSVPLSLSLSLSLQFVSACKWHVLSLNKIYLNLLILLEFLSFLINFVKKLPLKNIFRKKSVIIKIFIYIFYVIIFFFILIVYLISNFFFYKYNWMKGLN